MLLRGANILLVDDDEIDVMNVCRAFELAKITSPLFVARDGVAALEMLRGNDLFPRERRLILLDIRMPRMDGIEFLQALRSDAALRRTPVVVLTTSAELRDRIEAYDLNVAGYLLKTVPSDTFVGNLFAMHAYWSAMEMP